MKYYYDIIHTTKRTETKPPELIFIIALQHSSSFQNMTGVKNCSVLKYFVCILSHLIISF